MFLYMYFKYVIIITQQLSKKKKKSVEYARMGWLVVHPSDRDGLVGLFVRFALGDSDLQNLGEAKSRAMSYSYNTNRIVWKI